ncbi:MAG: hypothetical protein AAGJ74_09415 [Pseudomonadota bacterium]
MTHTLTAAAIALVMTASVTVAEAPSSGEFMLSSRDAEIDAPERCTQLEVSAGIERADCGTLTTQELVALLLVEDE